MWELDHKENWALKNWRFWACCWKLLRVTWTAKRSNQSILKEINPEYSLEGLMQKLQYVGHVMQRADSFEKTLMLGKFRAGEGDDRGWDGLMASLTRWTWVWACSGSWWWTGKPNVMQSMRLQGVGPNWKTELNWVPYDNQQDGWSWHLTTFRV